MTLARDALRTLLLNELDVEEVSIERLPNDKLRVVVTSKGGAGSFRSRVRDVLRHRAPPGEELRVVHVVTHGVYHDVVDGLPVTRREINHGRGRVERLETLAPCPRCGFYVGQEVVGGEFYRGTVALMPTISVRHCHRVMWSDGSWTRLSSNEIERKKRADLLAAMRQMFASEHERRTVAERGSAQVAEERPKQAEATGEEENIVMRKHVGLGLGPLVSTCGACGVAIDRGKETCPVSDRFYLSYADDGGWNGAVVVRGSDVISAAGEAHRLGISPGGQVVGVALPRCQVPDARFLDRLLTYEEVSSFWPDAASIGSHAHARSDDGGFS